MNRRAGQRLLLFLFLGALTWQTGRVCLHSGDRPVFFVQEEAGVYVWLGSGFEPWGVRQFGDDCRLADVIALTQDPSVLTDIAENVLQGALFSGESIAVERNGRGLWVIQRGMMTAAQRMAMGVPLHPDRMSHADWQDLPGIGPALAERIEVDRQENGDFGALDALLRVKGIGPKKIASWRAFF